MKLPRPVDGGPLALGHGVGMLMLFLVLPGPKQEINWKFAETLKVTQEVRPTFLCFSLILFEDEEEEPCRDGRGSEGKG